MVGANGRGAVLAAIAFLVACIGSAQSVRACGPYGDHVVVGVSFYDKDGGLLIRERPTRQSDPVGLMPPFAVGVSVGECTKGWCRVEYDCVEGWSSAKYLEREDETYLQVTGVSASDPEGLNLRTGPRKGYGRLGSIPYNGVNLIAHMCERNPSGSPWCLVTYDGQSGWVNSRYLTAQTSSVDTTPRVEPLPPSEDSDDYLACQKYPEMC